MISIKDFEVGKKAILLDKSYRKESASEVDVEKVGRKYVTVQLNRWCKREFEVNYSPYMLCEKTTYSPNMFLFPSEKSYQEFKEIKEIEQRISKQLINIPNRFSLNALREIENAINKAIEESENEE
jgi:hypothetical protein